MSMCRRCWPFRRYFIIKPPAMAMPGAHSVVAGARTCLGVNFLAARISQLCITAYIPPQHYYCTVISTIERNDIVKSNCAMS